MKSVLRNDADTSTLLAKKIVNFVKILIFRLRCRGGNGEEHFFQLNNICLLKDPLFNSSCIYNESMTNRGVVYVRITRLS